MKKIKFIYPKYQLTVGYFISIIFFFFSPLVNESKSGHVVVGGWGLLVLLAMLIIENRANHAVTVQQTKRIKLTGGGILSIIVLVSLIPLCWYLIAA